MRIDKPTWSESAIELLRQLWGTGLSASQIGERLGVTNNAVIGKARRIGLASRGSPIRPLTDEERAEREKQRLAREAEKALHNLRKSWSMGQQARVAAGRVKLPKSLCEVRTIPGSPCNWVMEHRGPLLVRYCDAPTREGSSYCPEHHAVCYRQPVEQEAA